LTDTPMTQRLAAILAADVAGYTRLMEADERATVAALDANRVIFRNRTTIHGGRIVDTAGDSVLAVFPSAIGAVEAAIAIQDEMRGLNAVLPQDRRMQFRLGVNLGDVIEKDDGSVYGSGVNVAARLEGLCEPGGVMISEDLHRQVAGKVSQAFADTGSHEVKNVAEPVHAFRLGTAEAPASPAEGPALPDRPSIAVLPFDNRSSDPEQEYFADGIAEDLITELSRFDGLFVIARNSTFQLKGSGLGVEEIGRRFGVRYVVEGSVRRAGDRVRISAQLTDVGEGGHIWAERYDRELNDVFAVQDDVTTHIVTAVSAELGGATGTKNGPKLTESLEAYDLYLQGRAYVERTTPVSNRHARVLLEKAIGLDDGFAAAFSELSMVKFRDWVFGWDAAPGLLDAALADAQAGIARDDGLAAAHTRLGWILTWRGEHDPGKAAARHAVALDPNFAEGHALWANSLVIGAEGGDRGCLASRQDGGAPRPLFLPRHLPPDDRAFRGR
jgi:adenylate cyclase